jgi:Arc/MetJ-type ribon-helix-helix transcriptional regulator
MPDGARREGARKEGARKVAKVTVSLPRSLLVFVEDERERTGAPTRSAVVVDMLSEVQRRVELTEREARYRAAYAKQPMTAEERAFLDAAATEAFAHAGEEWADEWAKVEPPHVEPAPGGSTDPTTVARKRAKAVGVGRKATGKAGRKAAGRTVATKTASRAGRATG